MYSPNFSNFLLLYGHMCYVKIVILRILPIFNGSAENYTVFALTFCRVYPNFFMIISGLRVCWWVNAFCSSDLLEIWNILAVVCGELWCVVRIHQVFFATFWLRAMLRRLFCDFYSEMTFHVANYCLFALIFLRIH